MGTPLVWKSFEITNRYYNTVLKYSLFFYMDPDSEQMRITKTPRTIIPFLIYLFLMCAVLVCSFVLILDAWLSRESTITMPLFMVNTYVTLVVFLCLLLIQSWCSGIDTIAHQYVGPLADFERKLSQRKLVKISELTCGNLLRQGIRILWSVYFNPVSSLICNTTLLSRNAKVSSWREMGPPRNSLTLPHTCANDMWNYHGCAGCAFRYRSRLLHDTITLFGVGQRKLHVLLESAANKIYMDSVVHFRIHPNL